MQSVYTSWSGGKDSCFACYKAAESGLKVRYLLNMKSEDGERSWIHGFSSELLKMQAQAIGIPLVQRRPTMATYETDYKDAVLFLKKRGVGGGVFGDIDLEEHRQWVERVCQEVDITPHLPLWGLSQEKILRDFIGLGFEAIIVVVKAKFFDEEWLGRKVDSDFLSYLSELKGTKGVTPCGEAGEYHTFVTDGPLFKQRIEILEANKVLRGEGWFLDILKSELRDK
ncbi:diphthine--ammonia ligase [Chloroflexota bacterium]